MAARKHTTTKRQPITTRTKRQAQEVAEETQAKTSGARVGSTSFLSRLWTNQTQVSFVLGAIVVLVLAGLLFRYFERPNEEAQPTNDQVNVLTTATPRNEVSLQPTATASPTQPVLGSGQTYTIKAGDTLWSIAETQLRDGYKWSDIAKVNNLSNPDMVAEGTTLQLPKVDQTVIAPTENKGGQVSGQATQVYKVVAGETLWSISQNVYGNPYMWLKIAQANNLAHPNIIHADNVLTIPPK